MNTTRILLPICNRLRTPTTSSFRLINRFPTSIGRALFRVKRPYCQRVPAAMNTPDNYRRDVLSKRDPTMESFLNNADNLERLIQMDGFKTWGFVIYRCTYQSDSDWETFMTRFLYHVRHALDFYNGLDLLDSFAPTVFEDRSFDGATTALVRKHFQEWAATAPSVEQPVGYSDFPEAGRYKFFLMVDQEALESVLGVPDPEKCDSDGFVRLVNGFWEPEVLDADELEASGVSSQSELEQEEPLEGLTMLDVGWMKVCYSDAQTWGYLSMLDGFRWLRYYQRPPLIQKYL